MNRIWIKFLPSFMRSRIEGRIHLQQALGNTGWLFADRVIRMCVGFFVMIWLARYLGPKHFGIYNYAIAFASLFSAVAALGLDNIAVRNIVKDHESAGEIIGTVFFLKLTSGILTLFLAIGAISMVRPDDNLARWMVGIVAAGFIFQAFDAIDFYFQSQVQSKYSVIAKNIAFLTINIVKILLLLLKAPVIAFVWAGFAEIVLGSFGLVISYRFKGHLLKYWKVKFTQMRILLKDSWPLILSGLAITVYVRIDQVMLGEMIGEKAVGIYSAATWISESLYFIPVAVASSIFPSIINAKKMSEELYLQRLQSIYDIMMWSGIGFAAFFTIFANDVINILFGNQYLASGAVLSIHIWSGIFVFLGVASGQFLMTENMTKTALCRTMSGAISNVMLNLILIPRHGVTGAAVATVISYFISTVTIAINKKSRINISLFINTLNVKRIVRSLVRTRNS